MITCGFYPTYAIDDPLFNRLNRILLIKHYSDHYDGPGEFER